MVRRTKFIAPEQVLAEVYGRTTLETGLSEKRRDEVITAAIYTSFRNQEFGTHFKLPSDYGTIDQRQDASGIDMIVTEKSGRKKQLQIKGVHIASSIERRKTHKTKGAARILGAKSHRLAKSHSKELTSIMKKELEKIVQDYSGLILLIDVKADLATQTSLEIAIRDNWKTVKNFMAKEVWFLRNVPVRAIYGKNSTMKCFSYKLIKVLPDQHTYSFSFAF